MGRPGVAEVTGALRRSSGPPALTPALSHGERGKGKRIRLTEVQERLLDRARVAGVVRIRLYDRRRRRAALRLKRAGLMAWNEALHGWVITDTGLRHLLRKAPPQAQRYRDQTADLSYSDFLREN